MSGTCVRRSVVAVIGVFLLQAAPAHSSHNGVPVPALAIDPVTPNTIYAGTPGGMFKSTDGGAPQQSTLQSD